MMLPSFLPCMSFRACKGGKLLCSNPSRTCQESILQRQKGLQFQKPLQAWVVLSWPVLPGMRRRWSM